MIPKKLILVFKVYTVQKRSKDIQLPVSFSGKRKNMVMYLIEHMITSGRNKNSEVSKIF